MTRAEEYVATRQGARSWVSRLLRLVSRLLRLIERRNT